MEDIPLSVEKINQEHLQNAPYQLHKATIKRLKIKLPSIFKLKEDPIFIKIKGIQVIMKKNKNVFNIHKLKQQMKNDEYNQDDLEQSYYEGNEGRSAGGAFNDSDDDLSDCDLNTTSNLQKKLNQIINDEQCEENHFKKIIQLILQNIQISVDDIQITMIHNDVYNSEQHDSQEWVYQQMKQGNLVNYQDYLVIQLRQIHYQNILYSENGIDSKKSEIKVNGLQIHITDEKDDPIKFLDQAEQTEMIMLSQNSKSAVFVQDMNQEIFLNIFQQGNLLQAKEQDNKYIQIKLPQFECIINGNQLKFLEVFFMEIQLYQQSLLEKIILQQMKQQNEQKKRKFNNSNIRIKKQVKQNIKEELQNTYNSQSGNTQNSKDDNIENLKLEQKSQNQNLSTEFDDSLIYQSLKTDIFASRLIKETKDIQNSSKESTNINEYYGTQDSGLIDTAIKSFFTKTNMEQSSNKEKLKIQKQIDSYDNLQNNLSQSSSLEQDKNHQEKQDSQNFIQQQEQYDDNNDDDLFKSLNDFNSFIQNSININKKQNLSENSKNNSNDFNQENKQADDNLKDDYKIESNKQNFLTLSCPQIIICLTNQTPSQKQWNFETKQKFNNQLAKENKGYIKVTLKNINFASEQQDLSDINILIEKIKIQQVKFIIGNHSQWEEHFCIQNIFNIQNTKQNQYTFSKKIPCGIKYDFNKFQKQTPGAIIFNEPDQLHKKYQFNSADR